MREDYGSLPLSIHDDGFGDIGGFETDGPDFIRDPNIDVIDSSMHRFINTNHKLMLFIQYRRIWLPKSLI